MLEIFWHNTKFCEFPKDSWMEVQTTKNQHKILKDLKMVRVDIKQFLEMAELVDKIIHTSSLKA